MNYECCIHNINNSIIFSTVYLVSYYNSFLA